MYSDKIKKIALSLYNKFKSYRKVALLLNISKSIIHYWNNCKYKSNKKTIPIAKIIKYVKSLLIKNNFITVKKITKLVNQKFNTKLSKSFIYVIIKKKLNYSYKKISKKCYSNNISKLIKRKNYSKRIYPKITTKI